MISFWNETLENISKDQFREKFKFLVNEISYEVPLSFALGISQFVTQKYMKDQTFNELKLNLSDSKNQFKNIIEGKEVEKDFLFEVRQLLGNKEMIEKWQKSEEISNQNIIKKIKLLTRNLNNSLQVNLEEEYNYVRKHFEEFKEEISQLEINEVIQILNNPKLVIEKEESIWEIIQPKIKEYPEKKIELLQCVNVQYLNSNDLREFIKNIECHEIEQFWDNLKPKILENLHEKKLENVPNSSIGKTKKKFEYQESTPFEGIFFYLNKVCGGNAHDKRVINITAFSTGYGSPQKVIDHDWSRQCWFSKYGSNQWIQFDFLEKKRIELTGYSIKTFSGFDSGSCHLKNWIIEGSNDGESWIPIDNKVNDSYLNGNGYQHYYPLPKITQPFQFIRLRQTGPTHRNDNIIDLGGIELFGNLIEL